MSRRIRSVVQMFVRSFAKNHTNSPRFVIVEQRKSCEDENIETTYNKLGGCSTLNFSTNRNMKSTPTKFVPYEHEVRMDEKYCSVVKTTPTYSSPLQGYGLNDKPSKKQEIKQPASQIVQNYYETIRRKKNAAIQIDRKTTAVNNNLSTALVPYTSSKTSVNNKSSPALGPSTSSKTSVNNNLSAAKVNYSHQNKSTDSTNTSISTLKPISRRVKQSSEAARLDDKHNQNGLLKNEHGKGIKAENNVKVGNMKGSEQYLNLKSSTSCGDIKPERIELINRKDVRRSVSTSMDKNAATEVQKGNKKVKISKTDTSDIASKTYSNSSGDVK